MVSASTSTMTPGASQSVPSSRRSSGTQRIISSFALNRPLPYGNIPQRRASGPAPASNVAVSISPPDVNLSGIEGFDYDYDAWGNVHPYLSRRIKAGKQENIIMAEGSISSPSLPIRSKEESSRRKLSRSSNASSRRSSIEGRMPRLLQQSISPPTTSSQAASAVGRPFSSNRGSKSLAEKGEPKQMPSLYDMSRGRSAHVSLGRRWEERRGASASVLSGADENVEDNDEVIHRRPGRRSGAKEARKNSASSLEQSLFSSDDGLSPSSEEDESVRNASRRSSMDKDRRRELRVLLAPSRGAGEAQSLSSQGSVTSPGEEQPSLDASLKKARRDTSVDKNTSALVSTDDENGDAANASALLIRRRSRSGRRLLGSSLGSSSSPQRRPATRLDVIPAGLTPDGLSDPLSFKMLIGSDADPLLGNDVGSVADMVDVEAVEWNDQQKQSPQLNAVDSFKSQLQKDRRLSVAEQERERRTGFAAAYQLRLASLLWSREPAAAKEQHVEEDKAVNTGSESESLLTSSLRTILRLPNLLLMPTLGPSRAKATTSEDAAAQQAKEEGKALGQELSSSAPSLLSSAKAASPVFSESAAQAAAREASEFRRRGVMNPLEGDSDVSAYVSGLGLPIDPDLELSSLVHLQTFRTSHTPKSRRGSLEKPISSTETGQHRRSYSDSPMEASLGLTLESLRSEAVSRGMFARKKEKATFTVIDEDEEDSRSRKDDRQASSARGCSRPAVSAPVPGGFSAYNSSDSEKDEEESSSRERKDRVVSKEERSTSRRSRTRRRSSSPPVNRKQCAVGLFDSKRRCQQVEEDADGNVFRVRSTPNLTSLSNKKRQSRHDGRGREGSVKVVSASLAAEDEPVKKAFLSGARAPSAPPQMGSRPGLSSRSALGLGLPGNPAGRACMVSNGAHLLMLSLELEMMRHRKITCSLKPRWLKARVRSDSTMRVGVSTPDGGREDRRIISTPTAFMPVAGSSLRFEVVPQ